MAWINKAENKHHVVIIGGGFGGLYAGKALRDKRVQVTIIDKRNFHLFQPLLYQVATGGLSPANIAAPLRGIFSRQLNTRVILDEATGFDPDSKRVFLKDEGIVNYDSLIIATGTTHSYFGHDEWEKHAPGLKTIEDATQMKNRIMLAFEQAEKEDDPEKIKELLTFVVIGAGPTGVELSGTLAEITRDTFRRDFRHIDTSESKIFLLEGLNRILPPMHEASSTSGKKLLEKLGVSVITNSMVTDIRKNLVTYRVDNREEKIKAGNILWAAGVIASPVGKMLHDVTGCELDKGGRVIVNPDLTVGKYRDIFVIGDLAHVKDEKGEMLPGVAQPAMQGGRYAAKAILAGLTGEKIPPFKYKDIGTMATIGRNAAVCEIGIFKLSGLIAWFMWLFVHLMYILGYGNKLIIFVQWAWNYFTWARQARLITNIRDNDVNEVES
ncbi:MAG TPA: NAD(P)/FAD-dependent oxidoreductase [bacterium]|jgi:NADH dehydrogenase